MTWTMLSPSRPTAEVAGRLVTLSPVWRAGSYQVAIANVLDPELGWAVWRLTLTGTWSRLVPSLRLPSASDAKEVAVLDEVRRRLVAGLPLRLAAAAVRASAGRVPVPGAVGRWLERHLAPTTASELALALRYLHALTLTKDHAD